MSCAISVLRQLKNAQYTIAGYREIIDAHKRDTTGVIASATIRSTDVLPSGFRNLGSIVGDAITIHWNVKTGELVGRHPLEALDTSQLNALTREITHQASVQPFTEKGALLQID